MWKYIRRTIKGLVLMTISVIVVILLIGLGAVLYVNIIEPFFGANLLENIGIILLSIWVIGFFLFMLYSAGEDWEIR